MGSKKDFRTEYYDGQEERLTAIEHKIHTESGPLSQCRCNICKNYRKTRTTGEFHEMEGCYCSVCGEIRYQKHIEWYGKVTADKIRKEKNARLNSL